MKKIEHFVEKNIILDNSFIDLRCQECGKKVASYRSGDFRIKCPRCGMIVYSSGR